MGMYEQLLAEKARREKARRQQARTGTPNIIEEMHPDVSWQDRAIVKNLSSSPEKSANYIKKHNPQLDTRVWDGRVLVKGKTETDWRTLDPDAEGFDGLKEFAMDVGDVAYDVGSGVLEGLALPTTGILGSAAVGAGSELARQAAGEALGIEDNISKGDIALSAGVAGAIPAVGKFARPVIEKAADFGKGAVRTLTEATADDVDVFAKQGADLDKVLDSPTGFTDAYREIMNEVAEKEQIFKKEIGQQFEELKKSGVTVDIEKAKDIYDAKLAELKITAINGSESDKALFEAMQKERDSLFKRDIPMKEQVDQFTDFSGAPGQSSQDLLEGQVKIADQTPTDGGLNLTPTAKREAVQEAAQVTGKKVTNKELVEDTGATLTDRLSGKDLSPETSKDIANLQDINYVMQLRQKLSARANFKNKSDLKKSLDSANLSESLAARGYGALGKAIDDVANNIGSKQAREQFKTHIEFVGEIAKHFNNIDSVESFMKAADRGSRKTVAEKLGRIDAKFGTNLKAKNKVLSTAQALGGYEDKNLMDALRPKSFLETLGAATGAKIGWAMGQPALIPVTLAAGAAIGRKFGSMKAARRYVDFIVSTEGKALGLDEQAQEILKRQLYKSVTGETAIREALKTSVKLNEDR
jgi:hypothetical protein